MCAVTKRHQQGEAAIDAQRSKNQGKEKFYVLFLIIFVNHVYCSFFYVFLLLLTAHKLIQNIYEKHILIILTFLSSVRLPQSSRCRRSKSQDSNPDWTSIDKARLHHESKLLFKAMAAWRNHHQQCRKNKVVFVLLFAPILPPTICSSLCLQCHFADKETAGKPFAQAEDVPEIL